MNLEFALESPNFTASEELRRKWWPMRPYTGILWADVLWLFLVGAIDAHILPSITSGVLPFTLMTPWLIVTFIVSPSLWAFIALMLGSIILETSSDAPRGMYITAFWVVFAILTLTRKTLSWRHAVPWLVTFFISSFFISNFEALLIFLRQDPTQLDFFHFAKQVVRVTLCVTVGMGFAQSWMGRFKGEANKP